MKNEQILRRRTLAFMIDCLIYCLVWGCTVTVIGNLWDAFISILLFIPVYHVVLEHNSPYGTIGKRIMGLILVARLNHSLTIRRLVIRQLIRPFSFIFAFGVLMSVANKQRRTFHDILSGVWIKRVSKQEPIWTVSYWRKPAMTLVSHVVFVLMLTVINIPRPVIVEWVELIYSEYKYSQGDQKPTNSASACFKRSDKPVSKDATYTYLVEVSRCETILAMHHQLRGRPLAEEMFSDPFYDTYWRECICAIDSAGVEPILFDLYWQNHKSLEKWENRAKEIHRKYQRSGDVVLGKQKPSGRVEEVMSWFYTMFLPTYRFFEETGVAGDAVQRKYDLFTFLSSKFGVDVWQFFDHSQDYLFYDDLVAEAIKEPKYKGLTPYWPIEKGVFDNKTIDIERSFFVRQPRVVGIEHGMTAKPGPPNQGIGNHRNYFSFQLQEKTTLLFTVENVHYIVVSKLGPLYPASGILIKNNNGVRSVTLEPGDYRLELSIEPPYHLSAQANKPIKMAYKATIQTTNAK